MSDALKSPIIARMKRAVEKVSPVIMRDFGEIESLQHSFKGTYRFASNTRKRVEQVLLEELKLPSEQECVVLGNTPLDAHLDPGRFWFIEPLAGFDNMMRALPQVAVSLAMLEVDSDGQHHWRAALVALPMLHETYFATEAGVFLERTMSSHTHPIKMKSAPVREGQVRLLASDTTLSEMPSGTELRQSGCAALDLALVAAGRLDGAVISDATPAALAGGACLAYWSGAKVTDMGGDVYTPQDTSIKALSASLA